MIGGNWKYSTALIRSYKVRSRFADDYAEWEFVTFLLGSVVTSLFAQKIALQKDGLLMC